MKQPFSLEMVRSMVHKPRRWLDGLQHRWTNVRLSRPYPARGEAESLGAYGERIVALYLQRKGYFILERSYRAKAGEIDLIAVWQRRVVVFVEVKTWANQYENEGGPSDAVDEGKQEKITKTAYTYMKRHRLLESAGRADVVQVVLGSNPQRPTIRHFENAFEAVGKFQMFT
jgi:putative endonuclease